jgi:hypothetical protein
MSFKSARLHIAALASLLLLISAIAIGQNKNIPWTEWSKKDAEKVLNNSPWAQTQVDTNVTEMFYTPTSRNTGAPNANTRGVEGALNQEIKVTYHIRFFSARPVRQALARLYQIQEKEKPDAESDKRLRSWAELESKDSIIMTVTFESTDGRFSGKAMQAFNSAVTSTLKNKTYLERNDGKRLFLTEYVLPGRDGFGARFIFPRVVDGQPFITRDAKEIRFSSEVSDALKLTMRFKVADMMYNGMLEY